jgi:aryl-phospho-beta-D-glucosidase BglC (GH1 family)
MCLEGLIVRLMTVPIFSLLIEDLKTSARCWLFALVWLVALGCDESQESSEASSDGPADVDTDTETAGQGTDSGDTAVPDGPGDVETDPPPLPAPGFLSAAGNRLVDAEGQTVRLTGINWFGFETSNQSPHGLWARDFRSMLTQIREVGFNAVRIPWSNAILAADAQASSVNTDGADPYDGQEPMNAPLEGRTPLEMLDLIVDEARNQGLKVILDNHSREPDGYMEETLWYTAGVPESQWIADWVGLAERYLGHTAVVGFDLNNEPHGEAAWGVGGDATDWAAAAERCGNAVLAANPDVLIIVEGVEKVGGDSYWWGGNLLGAKERPVVLSRPEKLVYSPHEYGPEVHDQPWFSAGSFPANMKGIWDRHFGYLMAENRGHLLVGEFGIKDPDAFEGRAGVWFERFMAYLGDEYSWTFWCWNPNSGDTQGILQDDWLTPHEWKLDALTPYLAPPIP